jgi:CheY-like chemotaxis protein
MQVWWQDLILYNDATIQFLGPRHPGAFAHSGREAWAEVIDQIGPAIDRVTTERIASWCKDVRLFVQRTLPNQEAFVTFAFTPIGDEDGTVHGVVCTLVETTSTVSAKRRLDVLHELSIASAACHSVDAACTATARVLERSIDDVPFAVLRLAEGIVVSTGGAVKIPDDVFAKVIAQCATTEIDVDVQHPTWPETTRKAIAMPIVGHAGVIGVLVCGVSPRAPLDDGYGSFFDLIASSVSSALADVAGEPLEIPLSSAQLTTPPGARRRLLLVEDNDDAARALKACLEQLGYSVVLAHNAPIALNLARSFDPDVALIDIGLPVMDGWELARRLREQAKHEVYCVAVTAYDQEQHRQRSQQVGFAAHLVKPIDLETITQVIEALPRRPPFNSKAQART